MAIPGKLSKLTPETLTLDLASRWEDQPPSPSSCQAPAGHSRRMALILEGSRLELSSGVPARCGLIFFSF